MRPLFQTGTGQKLLALGLIMIGMGSLMLRKIVNFKG
jgi:Flp pilus assembly protein TadB